MIRAKPYKTYDIDFSINDIPYFKEANEVLMCTPQYFDIIDVKNVHMEGNKGLLDKTKAIKQWEGLYKVYEKLKESGHIQDILTIEGQNGCEDMVFCANQTFPWRVNKQNVVVLSQMHHTSRQKEVPFFEAFFERKGYKVYKLTHNGFLEGMGDMIPHPGRALIYGGYGYRTGVEVYDEVSKILDTIIVPLRLIDERFYHLDTCFVPLDEHTVMLCKEAFDKEALSAIEKMFDNVISIPIKEVEENFSLNVHTIRSKVGNTAILHPDSNYTKKVLYENDYEVLEVNTSEYMKSGGSVFCMKLMIY